MNRKRRMRVPKPKAGVAAFFGGMKQFGNITEFGKITVSAFKRCVGHGRIRRQLDEWKQGQGQD